MPPRYCGWVFPGWVSRSKYRTICSHYTSVSDICAAVAIAAGSNR
jgi:hypothetical protein